MLRDRDTSTGCFRGQKISGQVQRLSIGDAGGMSEDDRRAPREGSDLIVRLNPMPPHDEDVVVDLIGKEQISLLRVLRGEIDRPFGEPEPAGQMDEFGFSAENFCKFVGVDFEGKLRDLGDWIRRILFYAVDHGGHEQSGRPEFMHTWSPALSSSTIAR